ncbi:MAG: hypothetical protein K2N73_11315 [Lachnospiraceae bacterium]|nr:hypothetical protein [Lachnospiraceae bacterium]
MYLLSILFLIVFCIGYSLMISGGNIYSYLDLASLILIILSVLPILLSTGLLKDFNNAFRLSIKRREAGSQIELQRAVEAVNLVIKTLWAAGVFHFAFGTIHVMASMEGVTLIRGISVSMITLLYAVFFIILLLPLRTRLHVCLLELAESPAEPKA